MRLITAALLVVVLTAPAFAHIGFSAFHRVETTPDGIAVTMWVDRAHAAGIDPSAALTRASALTTISSGGEECRVVRSLPAVAKAFLTLDMLFACPSPPDRLDLAGPSVFDGVLAQYIEMSADGARETYVRGASGEVLLDTGTGFSFAWLGIAVALAIGMGFVFRRKRRPVDTAARTAAT